MKAEIKRMKKTAAMLAITACVTAISFQTIAQEIIGSARPAMPAVGAGMPTAKTQSSIVYLNAPSLSFDWSRGARVLDLNNDGLLDLSFSGLNMVCTADYPTSSCWAPFYADSVSPSELLTGGSDVHLNSFGDAIGGDAPAGTAWSTPGFSGAGLLFYWWNRSGQIINDQVVYSGWFGPLSKTGTGYIGVRFHAADGLHYGWIRVRMPNPNPSPNIIEFGPVLVDCAYESRPNVLIHAGDIGASSDSIQFVVDLRNPDGTPHGSGQYHSAGTAILTGKTLRFELDMVGWFYSAELRGPAPSRSRSKRLYFFGQPLVAIHSPCTPESCDPDFTVFFGEAVLNPGEVIQLKRGALYVSIDNAAVIGTCKLAE